eukprot:TRINITY_DN1236_c2_g3_i1.p1 TRINITY_DN1236_c2_g3~~TRINITY_DN1236_c2_g3_i1.p1  ORF type:complete len:667 (+),score=158.22 TRINITY_DN1236_c2_g3_i1:36-2003(+)
MPSISDCCAGCLACVARLTLRSSDTADDVNVKLVFVPVYIVVGSIGVLTFMNGCAAGDCIAHAGHLSLVVVMLASWGSFAVSVFSSAPPRVVLGCGISLCTVAVILLDWSNAAGALPRMWSLAVLTTDASMMGDLPQWLTNSLVHVIALWLVVERACAMARVDIYSVALLGNDVHRETTVCDCASPPCDEGRGTVINLLAGFITVLYLDFIITRGFASSMKKQLRLARSTLQVSAEVARHLSDYNIEEARQALEAKCGDEMALSPELQDTYERLLGNLQTYRPYLPQSCFPSRDSDAGSDVGAPIGDMASSASQVASLALPDVGHKRSRLLSTTLDFGLADSIRRGPESLADSVNSIQPAGAVHFPPRMRRVTLLRANECGFLTSRFKDSGLSTWIDGAIAAFCDATVKNKGVVELVSGDHRFANFNASRPCLSHRVWGTRCGADVASRPALSARSRRASVETPTCVAVCSGICLAGDFGTDSFRQFMVSGPTYIETEIAVRTATLGGIPVLVDGKVHSDICTTWEVRLREGFYVPKLNTRMRLWQPLRERVAAFCDEWMYQLEQGEQNPWDAYNDASVLWLEGMRGGAVETLDKASESSPAVAEAARELRARIQECPVPKFVVSQFSIQREASSPVLEDVAFPAEASPPPTRLS